MEIQLKDFIESGKIVAFLNFKGSFKKLKNNSKISYILDNPWMQNISVEKYFKKHFPKFSKEKFDNACRMVLLDIDVFQKNISKLSTTEYKKLRFVEALLNNSDTFLFENFEQGFYGRNRSYYQKLFHKLTKYGKCVIVITKDVSFLMGMVSRFVLFTPNNYFWINDFYDNRLYEYVEMPVIVMYLKYLQSKGLKIENYIETKEVLKAIYRSVSSGERL